MKRLIRAAGTALLLTVVSTAPAACSGSRTRAVRNAEPDATKEAGNFQEMLATARRRTTEEDSLGPVVRGLEVFRTERGRLPTNLFEMVHSGTMRAIPPPPAGAAYAYDPRSGNVRFVPVDDRGRVAVPDDNFKPPQLLHR